MECRAMNRYPSPGSVGVSGSDTITDDSVSDILASAWRRPSEDLLEALSASRCLSQKGLSKVSPHSDLAGAKA